MIDFVTVIIVGFLTIIFSVNLHEKGHIDVAKKYGYKVSEKFYYNTWKFWEWKWTVITDGNPTCDEEKKIIENGIILGFFPVLVSFFLLGWFGLFVALLYLAGIKSDLKRYFEVLKECNKKL